MTYLSRPEPSPGKRELPGRPISPTSPITPTSKTAQPEKPKRPIDISESLLQKQNIFRQSKPKSMRMYVHDVASGTASNTEYEGASLQETTEEFLYGVERTRDLLKYFRLDRKVSCPTLSSQAIPLLILDRSEESASSCHKQVSSMKPGDTIIIRLATHSARTGHALNMMVNREKSGTFQVSLINTGQGLRFHRQIQEGPKIKYQSALTFEGISKQHIVDHVFWGQIQNSSIDGLYSIAKHYLGRWGTQRDAPPELSSLFVASQKGGNCTMQVMLDTQRHLIYKQVRAALGSSQEAYEQYKTFALMYKMQSAIDVAQTYLKKNEYRRGDHTLILDSLGALAERIDETLSQGLIDEACASQLTSTLEEIRLSLQTVKYSHPPLPSEHFATNIHTQGALAGESHILHHIESIQKQGKSTVAITEKILFPDGTPSIEKAGGIMPYLDQMSSILDRPPAGLNFGNRKAFCLYTLRLLEELPLPGSESYFGAHLGDREAREVAEKLIKLQKKILQELGPVNRLAFLDRRAGFQAFLLTQKTAHLVEDLYLRSSPKVRS
ncbi:MAG: hypothetical protein AAGG81_07920, partial [Chlamydiota bacterium]